MTDLDDHGRPEPPLDATEADTLLGFLDFHRATLEWKTRGLTDDQLRTTLPPSTMSLGGLLKHLALVEDHWFAEVAGGAPEPEPWASVDWTADREWDWHSAAQDPGDALRALWAASVARSRAVTDRLLAEGPGALGRLHARPNGRTQFSLRWILTHMVEEYARHNGHADLLRESIDGSVGE
ncbi:DinB family protein [Sinomonas atrocyanea]